MPIPGLKSSEEFIRLDIYDEVIRARINRNSRFSFLKREIIKDLGIFENIRAISIRVTCNGKLNVASFILEDSLEYDSLLGTDFLENFNIGHAH